MKTILHDDLSLVTNTDYMSPNSKLITNSKDYNDYTKNNLSGGVRLAISNI